MAYLKDLDALIVERMALDAVPESIAIENCALAVSIDSNVLRIILPNDSNLPYTIEKLQFVLNRPIVVDTADRDQIVSAISRNYSSVPIMSMSVDLPSGLPVLSRTNYYEFLDMVGAVEHRTSSSVTFKIGKKTDYLVDDDGSRHFVEKDFVFNVLGWLDAHYPCEGFHKLLVKCILPGDYVSFESMCGLIKCVMRVLELPIDVSYKIYIHANGHSTCMENPKQGFVCTTKWRFPDEEAT
ncbi:MAG: hypothetical protein JNK90_08195 [Planctomycetaceae bacterium]|nr:hypothetical protein [Planctomycetaceae bacterium]